MCAGTMTGVDGAAVVDGAGLFGSELPGAGATVVVVVGAGKFGVGAAVVVVVGAAVVVVV